MPAKAFLQNLTNEEIDVLDDLPEWDGRNEIVLSSTVLGALRRAIWRYRKKKLKAEPFQLYQ